MITITRADSLTWGTNVKEEQGDTRDSPAASTHEIHQFNPWEVSLHNRPIPKAMPKSSTHEDTRHSAPEDIGMAIMQTKTAGGIVHSFEKDVVRLYQGRGTRRQQEARALSLHRQGGYCLQV